MSKSIDSEFETKTKFLWHSTQVYCLVFDRTGKFIFTGGDDGVVKIYSVVKDRLIKCLCDQKETEFADEVESVFSQTNNELENESNIESKMERFAVCDVAVNYENTLIAAAKHSGSIPVWNLQTFQLIIRLDEQVFPIRSIRFSPIVFDDNKKYLISTSNDGFIFYYTYDQKSLQFSPKSLHRKGKYDGERALNICCDNSSGGLLIGVMHTFGVKNETSKPKSKKAPMIRNEVQSAIRIFSLSDELGPKEEWKTTNHKSHSECEYSLRFCHKSFRFASGCDKDSNAFIWSFDKSNKKWDSIIIDINTKGDKKILRGKSKQSVDSLFVEEIIFSSGDKYVITNLSDYSIKIWNSESGELVQHFEKYHTNKVSTIECHPFHDHIFLSAGYDSNIFIYDITTGIVLKKFDCSLKAQQINGNTVSKNNEINDIKPQLLQCSYSPDGQTIAATDSFGNLSIFSSESQKEANRLDQLEEELFRIHAESDGEDGLTVPEIMPSDKDLQLINSLFEYESDLLKGIEKPSPSKSMQSNDEKKGVSKLDLNTESTVAKEIIVKKSPVSVSKRKFTKKKSPLKKTLVETVPEIALTKEITDSEAKPNESTCESTPKSKINITSKQTKFGKSVITSILNQIFENPNSIPFQTIDHIRYPTYRQEISDADLSFSSIREDMFTNNRYSFAKFNKDMNTVFENVKKFFKHKDDETHEMALTLEKYYCNKMEVQFNPSFKPPANVDTSDEESDVEVIASSAPTSLPKKVEPKVKKPLISLPLRAKSTRNKSPKSNENESKQTKPNSSETFVKTNGSQQKPSMNIKKRASNSTPIKPTNKRTKTNPKVSSDSEKVEELDKSVDKSSQNSKTQDLESLDLEPIKLADISDNFVEEVEVEDEVMREETGIKETLTNAKAVINGNSVQIHSNSCDKQNESSNLKNSLFCIFCDEFFWDKSEATSHYVMHMCPLLCDKCKQEFSSYDQYLNHSCEHPKTSDNIKWCRHYSDSIVWIDNFIQFQKTADIESFDEITDSIKNCVVCEKVQQFRPKSDYKVREIIQMPYDVHLEKHLKYVPQFQCLICFLNEDKYFYCKNSAEAEKHLSKEHESYTKSESNALTYFDGSIPKLDEIIAHFYS